ncbi:putative C2 domain-containing protein [Helianthus debilis subsp. tardiflorus]
MASPKARCCSGGRCGSGKGGGGGGDNLLGLLKVKIKRGLSLAVRDITDSDPYVVIKMGDQKQKTRVVNKDVNPVWDEDLTLSVEDANLPIKLTVYDHDMLSKDDPMGDAEFEIKSFVDALKLPRLERHPNGTVLKRIPPVRTNYLAEESCIIWKDKEVVQQLSLRLRNVETGEVDIELRWIHDPPTTM